MGISTRSRIPFLDTGEDYSNNLILNGLFLRVHIPISLVVQTILVNAIYIVQFGVCAHV